MTREEFKNLFKAFCKTKGFEYCGHVELPGTELVYWRGDMCVKPFEEWVAAIGVKEWTKPELFSDGKGESFASYVTF